jgi:hypothetical protein
LLPCPYDIAVDRQERFLVDIEYVYVVVRMSFLISLKKRPADLQADRMVRRLGSSGNIQ